MTRAMTRTMTRTMTRRSVAAGTFDLMSVAAGIFDLKDVAVRLAYWGCNDELLIGKFNPKAITGRHTQTEYGTWDKGLDET